VTRPEDLYPFLRNEHAAVMRVGTVVSATATRLAVDMGGGVIDVGYLTQVTNTAPGARVTVLLDRDTPLAIGNVKP
jgi:hypothetical protein